MRRWRRNDCLVGVKWIIIVGCYNSSRWLSCGVWRHCVYEYKSAFRSKILSISKNLCLYVPWNDAVPTELLFGYYLIYVRLHLPFQWCKLQIFDSISVWGGKRNFSTNSLEIFFNYYTDFEEIDRGYLTPSWSLPISCGVEYFMTDIIEKKFANK